MGEMDDQLIRRKIRFWTLTHEREDIYTALYSDPRRYLQAGMY